MNEAEQVAKGARLLDKILPGWHREIDLKHLQMSSGTMCILGQTFGVHNERCLAREMYPEEWQEAVERAEEYFGKNMCNDEGYAEGYAISAIYSIGKMIPSLLAAHNIPAEPGEIAALAHVCTGHDNKCEWAEEIATRLVADADSEAEGGQS